MARNKLIRDFSTSDPSSMEDLYLCIAKTIENSLLEAGAEAEKDYNIIDLYKLAQPFVMSEFQKGSLSFIGG